MDFIIICIVSLLALGVIAAVASAFTKGGTDAPVSKSHDCSTCASVATGECKIGCLIEEKKRQKEDNNAFLPPKQKK
jgi:hypothetical protein